MIRWCGKTKHWQSLLLPDRNDMMLCDCPGLVFPSFASNTADLIAAGVYPIAQMRDHWPVIDLICQRIPREIINASYGIHMPEPSAQELKERGLEKIPPPTAEEFLTTYCVARSMLAASSGVPDYTRASRLVIKDYVSGKLLYCHPPPNATDEEQFHLETVKTAIFNSKKLREKLAKGQAINASEAEPTEDEGDAQDTEPAFDDDLLDIIAETPNATGGGEKRGKAHKTRKKPKKKGHRGQDPYGMFKSPDEQLRDGPLPGIVKMEAGSKKRRSKHKHASAQ